MRRHLALLLSTLLFTLPMGASESIKGGPTESNTGMVGSNVGGGVVDVLRCAMAADQTEVSANAEIPIVWDYDTCTSSGGNLDTWFPAQADASTLGVPAGIAYFNVHSAANQEGSAAIDRRRVFASCVSGCTNIVDDRWNPQFTYTTTASAITTAAWLLYVNQIVLEVGDTWEINQVQHSAGSLDIFSSGTHLIIEAY